MAGMMQNMAGMGNMTEQVIATDFLLAAKAGIKNYAAALSETATPEVRQTLRKQLDAAIETHEKITNYMIKQGYYNAYNPKEQIRMDMQAAETVMGLQQQS